MFLFTQISGKKILGVKPGQGQGDGPGQGDEEGAAGVHCLESSMMNCYGLKSLHDYLQLPFLALKRDHFYHQMKHVEEEFNSADRALRIALLPASKAVYNAFARSYDSRARSCTVLYSTILYFLFS